MSGYAGGMKRRLGELLVDRRHITPGALDAVVQEQTGTLVRLGELLLERKAVEKQALAEALRDVIHIPYLDAGSVRPEAELLELVPREAALHYHAIPVQLERSAVVMIMAEPQNLRFIDELQFLCGRRISPRLGFHPEIDAAIAANYPVVASPGPEVLPEAEEDTEFLTRNSSARAQAAVREFQAELRQERTPAVRLVSRIMTMAARRNASDIHVEPLADDMVIRFRVDGILQEAMRIASEISTQLISRLKIVADMDISEHRAPQDGRFLVRIGERQFDIRASSIATQYGEKMVLRLLDPTAALRSFRDMGFDEEHADALDYLLRQPQGMVLVTGPTGSGKTTTLYAALNQLRSPKVNIVTIEDPVEYLLEGVNQVQVNTKGGRSFADCLRSMLRQDPNVMLLGEIRDTETAEIALQAAQTGHLVLSTMHTNDAVAAVTRLLDLDVPAFLIAASLSGVIAQRLVRKLCVCKREHPLTADQESELPHAVAAELRARTLFFPVGCPECEGTGYRGRLGVYELLQADDEIRAAIRSGSRDTEIRDSARAAGMRLMQEDALRKVEEGITTLEEVMRLVPFEFAPQRRCPTCNRNLAPAFLFCPYCAASLTAAGRHPGGRRRRVMA